MPTNFISAALSSPAFLASMLEKQSLAPETVQELSAVCVLMGNHLAGQITDQRTLGQIAGGLLADISQLHRAVKDGTSATDQKKLARVLAGLGRLDEPLFQGAASGVRHIIHKRRPEALLTAARYGVRTEVMMRVRRAMGIDLITLQTSSRYPDYVEDLITELRRRNTSFAKAFEDLYPLGLSGFRLKDYEELQQLIGAVEGIISPQASEFVLLLFKEHWSGLEIFLNASFDPSSIRGRELETLAKEAESKREALLTLAVLEAHYGVLSLGRTITQEQEDLQLAVIIALGQAARVSRDAATYLRVAIQIRPNQPYTHVALLYLEKAATTNQDAAWELKILQEKKPSLFVVERTV